MSFSTLVFRAAAWLRYAATAKSRYYLHSPFVYQLMSETLRDPIPDDIKTTLTSFLNAQRSDQSKITLTAIGTAQHNGKHFSVSELSKRCALPMKYGRLLFQLTRHFQPNVVLETGTGTGFSAACLALAAPNALVHTVDAMQPLIDTAKKHHQNIGLQNIRYHQGDLDFYLKSICDSIGTIDAVYLDANHTYDATIRYFNTVLPFLSTKAFVVVDDIHWSRGMNKAWLQLCKHPSVTLSLEFYRLGVLFLNPDFSKENYRLYY